MFKVWMWLALVGAVSALAATSDSIERGKAEEQRGCVACHGAPITHMQRLSRAAWEKELDKMVRWGASIKDREDLLDYLISECGDDKPPAKPPLTPDGTAREIRSPKTR
ncbi:MAG: hypothetical protein M3Z85_19050 [Acidobacteriota bacterium]|nr:hypothetical protein [Acidobacteriota bacterium]